MFGSNKKKVDLDKSRADYERAIKRCYGSDRVTLALCSFECFTGLNVVRGASDRKRRHIYSDDFVMKGVVHEFTEFDRHVPCTLKVSDIRRDAEDEIGSLMLTHFVTDEHEPPELRELALQAIVYDMSGEYAAALQQYLRDAALSDARFMHVRVMCRNVADEEDAEEGTPIDLMRERGYGPSRTITELHMWPSLVLPKAPAWARGKE